MRKALAIIALGIVTTITALIGGGVSNGELAKTNVQPVELAGHGWG